MYEVPNTIKEIVKGTIANYLHCEASCLIYEIKVDDLTYEFPIDVSDRNDIGNARFDKTHKATTLMRYINKAIKAQTLRWS
jgi:hypothetical protein